VTRFLFFSFSLIPDTMADHHDATKAHARPTDAHPLDRMTGGAFSAPTSGERAGRVRDWLATEPTPEQVQEVFKELSARDKGAAKPLREKLDELKRAKGQEMLAADWGAKARALLSSSKLNIADALAWQRDAAKAGAPLSREPLSSLKAQLAEHVRTIEDLQHRVQVQREAAVLLAQRTEVLSTKPWRDAESAAQALQEDVQHWQVQADEITADALWASVDVKYPPLLDGARTQLLVVWDAFKAALAQATAAAADAAAPLPTVPVWAEEIAHARGGPAPGSKAVGASSGATAQQRNARPKADPAVVEAAQAAVAEAVAKLEQETADGHGKASAGAAAALRVVLKEHGRHIDAALEAKVNAALAAAGELEGWQRWGADRAREDLVARAEALLQRPEGQALGGRKMQETLRQLRDQWKRTDQAGPPNHGLWRRFDAACTEAHKVVEAWLERIKADAAEHRAQRLALIEELKTWTASIMGTHDLKAVSRGLHQFADRWRDAGHLGEKAFAEIQPLWKEAFTAAAAPLEAEQEESVARRHVMIEEANVLGAAPELRIDAVKSLQQRWQAEAQAVPLDRRQEQKLWDTFRKPIDDAFQRKTSDREKVAAATSEHDRLVLQASKAVEAAAAAGDAQKIRTALSALEAATRGQALAAAQLAAIDALTGNTSTKNSEQNLPPAHDEKAPSATPEVADSSLAGADSAASTASSGETTAVEPGSVEGASAESVADQGEPAAASTAGEAPQDAATGVPAAAPVAAPPPPPKKVVAVRGDDRPGARNKAEPGGGARGGPGGRPGGRPGGPGGDRGAPSRGGDRFGVGGGRFGDREPREERGPRLGDAAFRAQRDALEHAQATLRKLAAQAHGEALTQLLEAWEKRNADGVPGTQEFGGRVAPAVRSAWTQALGKTPSGDAGKAAAEALLRLEMAADAPTPAEHISARRMLQLQMLTRRNDPAPTQTWGEDAARVLAAPHEAQTARRLQTTLKTLLRG
jgi:ATP-dependent RNA helicase SUPV3L1/SUV3